MCILELDHANWPGDLNTWAIITKLGSFSPKTFFFQKKLKLEIFIKQWGSCDQKLLKKLKICLKKCHDFVSTHEKHLKFSQNEIYSMWKKCGKFQVEILYTFEVNKMILVPVVLYIEKHMSVNVIKSTLSEPRTIICKQ